MAERGDDQLLGTRAHNLGALLAALPADQGELFDTDVLEAVGAHVVGRPGRGVLLGARARRSRAEAGGDLGDVVEGDIALQRLIAHLFGGADSAGVLRHDRRGDKAERHSAGGHQTDSE